jgi:hypothetical protein
MEQILKSTGRLFWAFSLLGMQELLNAARLARSPAGEQVGTPSAADYVGKDTNPPSLSHGNYLDIIGPRGAGKALLDMARHAAGVFAYLSPVDDWSIATLELHNKLTAFNLFEHVDQELDFSADRGLSLQGLLRQVDSLGPYYRVWAAEGLGHNYADLQIAAGLPLCTLPEHQLELAIPSQSLVPLHAGIGLALAEHMLSTLDSKNSSESEQAVNSFIEFCRRSLHPGYREIAYEGLGLATRNLHPQAIRIIEEALSRISPELAEYFWHGVGRAIYFSPSNFSPHRNAPWKGFIACLHEADSPSQRRNAVAGFAWALTLVNIRHPAVMAAFLRHHGTALHEEAAFYNGVCSALTIWRISSGTDDDLARLGRYNPASTAQLETWKKLIGRACEEVMANSGSGWNYLEPGKLFRYGAHFPSLPHECQSHTQTVEASYQGNLR